MAALIEVQDLTITFPRATPVRNLSFSIERGETLALVGESGSGKSLTALSLLRLLPSTAQASGKIQLAGRELSLLSEHEFRHLRGRDIAMVFQEPMTSLNPVLSIGTQISEVLRRHENLSRTAARKRAAELLELVRIPEPVRRLDEFPHQLSGGMRQRVMIAIAVACSPRLLIADEPTTALDVTIQAQILDLLDSLRRDLDMALLLITHDLGVVAEWADRVVVMYAGRKVEEASHETIFDRPLHPYTRGLLAASPRLESASHYTQAKLAEIPGSIASASAARGCAFAARCTERLPFCAWAEPKLATVIPGHDVACPITQAREFGDVAVAG